MKKVFLMLVVAAGCFVMTSCKSDAEKVAQLRIDYEKAIEDGDLEKAEKIEKEAKEIIGDREDDEDFAKECKEAYKKLKKDKE